MLIPGMANRQVEVGVQLQQGPPGQDLSFIPGSFIRDEFDLRAQTKEMFQVALQDEGRGVRMERREEFAQDTGQMLRDFWSGDSFPGMVILKAGCLQTFSCKASGYPLDIETNAQHDTGFPLGIPGGNQGARHLFPVEEDVIDPFDSGAFREGVFSGQIPKSLHDSDGTDTDQKGMQLGGGMRQREGR